MPCENATGHAPPEALTTGLSRLPALAKLFGQFRCLEVCVTLEHLHRSVTTHCCDFNWIQAQFEEASDGLVAQVMEPDVCQKTVTV